MRELAVRTTVENCSAKKFWELCLQTPATTQRMHRLLSKDENAEVTEWNPEGIRNVAFCMRVNIPQWLLSMVGVDVINVREEQSLAWEGDERLTVVSEPQVVGVPLSSSTTTRIVLAVTNVGLDAELEFTVQVSAAMKWPMSSAMEAIMAGDAKANVANQMEFFRTLLREAEPSITDTQAVPAARPPLHPVAHMYSFPDRAIHTMLERKRTMRGLSTQGSMIRGFYDAVEILDNEHPTTEPLTEVLVDDSEGALTEPLLAPGGKAVSVQGSAYHTSAQHGAFAWEEPITMIARSLQRTDNRVKLMRGTLSAGQTIIVSLLIAVVVLQSLILLHLRRGS